MLRHYYITEKNNYLVLYSIKLVIVNIFAYKLLLLCNTIINYNH